MKILQKLLLSLLLSMGMLSVMEVFAWTQLKDDIYVGDPAYFWKLKPQLDQQIQNGNHPFHLKTNSLGFRDGEFQETERWLFLGCSTTLGWGVEEQYGFVSILEEHFPNVDIMNGGQPGWSTAQVIQNLAEFQSLGPTRVIVGLGVRDAQLSAGADKDASPASWMARRNVIKWLRHLKSGSSSRQTSSDRQMNQKFRVEPEVFEASLRVIRDAFPTSEVIFYEFPQVEYSTEHSKALDTFNAWKTEGFTEADFFEDDPIHLTEEGHKRLAEWFAQKL